MGAPPVQFMPSLWPSSLTNDSVCLVETLNFHPGLELPSRPAPAEPGPTFATAIWPEPKPGPRCCLTGHGGQGAERPWDTSDDTAELAGPTKPTVWPSGAGGRESVPWEGRGPTARQCSVSVWSCLLGLGSHGLVQTLGHRTLQPFLAFLF